VKALLNLGINFSKLRREILKIIGASTVTAGKTRGKTHTPTLDRFSRDLVKLAEEEALLPVIGREKEIERAIQILCRKTKHNPILIGEAGVGKTAIVEGLAQRIAQRKVPEPLSDKRIVMLDIASIVAGTRLRGEFEERMKYILQEVKNASDVILFIDEIHTLIGAGSAEGSLDAANLLKPALARGEIRCIGATTLNEYKKYIEKDPALERRFQPIYVKEPSENETIEILKGIKKEFEEHHKVVYDEKAIEKAAILASRYIYDRYLPDKAIDLIDEAGARARIKSSKKPQIIRKIEEQIAALTKQKNEYVKLQEYEKAAAVRDEIRELQAELDFEIAKWHEQEKQGKKLVTEEDIYQVVSLWTGIPSERLMKDEKKKLLKLEEELSKKIIGQEKAIEVVARAIRRGRLGIKNRKKPTGSFIFLGPTGVGKTALAKALAEILFGDERSLIRLDMSEFMEKHSVSRLIGAPPGYVGYEEGGYLTEKIRRRPYQVILFDEIEKAHPDVFNILLQILEEGELTDHLGHTVNFRETIIIITSNIGANKLQKAIKMGFYQQSENDKSISMELISDELKETFRPEFLNRIDEIVVFNFLTKEHLSKILDIMLDELNKDISELYNITISISKSAKNYLVEKAYDKKYGARPLRRIIQKEIEDNLSTAILKGKLSDNQIAYIDYDEKKGITIKTKKRSKKRKKETSKTFQ
jgi:ATP-dependent Clp protease ATP-binding subunit ClpC